MMHRKLVIGSQYKRIVWITRIVVGIVFIANLNAAFAFILQPSHYAPGFELDGIPGRAIVQGIGILFLMWNVTYPFVILQPMRNMTIFMIVLIQQTIGIIGETWIYLTLPGSHTALRQTGLRFILFDGGGLFAMLIMYLLLWKAIRVDLAISRNKTNL